MATPSSRLITPSGVGKHAVLLTYTAIALFPIVLVVMNSFRSGATFKQPLELPNAETFSHGYETLGKRGISPATCSTACPSPGDTPAGHPSARWRLRAGALPLLPAPAASTWPSGHVPIRIGTVAILG
jgi:hypothetical protein